MRVTTGDRLKELMRERNLKQVDILNKVRKFERDGIKISKPDLSQYVNGKTEPRQEKLYILAEALDVNEAWLMGYDTDKERVPNESRDVNKVKESTASYSTDAESDLTDEEILTLAAHRVGHEGRLSEEEIRQIKKALRIALDKD